MAKNPTGRCPSCRSRAPVRRDGVIGAHVSRPRKGAVAMRCPGTGEQPVPLIFDSRHGLPDCLECAERMYRAGLSEAVHSVGIESGGSPLRMLRDYLAGYHEDGHEERQREEDGDG